MQYKYNNRKMATIYATWLQMKILDKCRSSLVNLINKSTKDGNEKSLTNTGINGSEIA